MTPPTAKRAGPISTTNTTAGQYPTWQDYEIMYLEKNMFSPGVINKSGGDFAVAQRGAGANLSVDVAAGNAYVQITNTNIDGTTYNVPFYCGVTTNVNITAADPTNPRIDLIVLQVDVSQNPDSGAGNIAKIIAVAGTPAGSPSAPATPANSIALAQVAVAANAVSIVNANITDVRTSVAFKTNVMPSLALATETAAIRNNSAFFATCTGSSNAYAATYSSLPALVTGLRVYAKANFANTSAATFNYNSGGAVAIKKFGGTADVVSGDIANNMLMCLEYDGTNWQLMNPVAQIPAITGQYQKLIQTTSDSAAFPNGTTSTAETDCPVGYQYTIPANSLAVGQEILLRYEAYNELLTSGTLTLRPYVGSQALTTLSQATATSNKAISVNIRLVCQAIGGSGTLVYFGDTYNTDGNAYSRITKTSFTVDTTANQTIKLTSQFSVGNVQHKEHVTDFQAIKILTP